MKIGQRLRRAMKRADLTQKELSRRTGMHETTISKVMKGETRSPNWETVETLVNAIGTTWGDLFEEPRIHLSVKDAALTMEFKDFLERLLANDAAQKQRHRTGGDEIHDTPDRGVDEVVELSDKIPGPYVVKGARPYRVITDSMIGVGIMEGSMIWAKPSVHLDAADGKIAIVRLNKTLFLKRVDRRGQRTVLTSENPRYGDIEVRGEKCELVAILVP
jgi:SOS-response transcriptional repressor LexA